MTIHLKNVLDILQTKGTVQIGFKLLIDIEEYYMPLCSYFVIFNSSHLYCRFINNSFEINFFMDFVGTCEL